MPFSNTDYLYQNLPERYRREDQNLFLKRFLGFFGETLDRYDQVYDEFYRQINPETASEAFINFWLDRLFGWSFYPKHFTLKQKRRLYANFAQHLARRGTAKGIELFLKDFGVTARVWTKERFVGNAHLDEPSWTVNQPLRIIVEIIGIKAWNARSLGTLGNCFLGSNAAAGAAQPIITRQEIATLLRFQQPAGQRIYVTYRRPGK